MLATAPLNDLACLLDLGQIVQPAQLSSALEICKLKSWQLLGSLWLAAPQAASGQAAPTLPCAALLCQEQPLTWAAEEIRFPNLLYNLPAGTEFSRGAQTSTEETALWPAAAHLGLLEALTLHALASAPSATTQASLAVIARVKVCKKG
jgi:hypothetical protein